MQRQALTFVLPEIWDDPKENEAFYEFVKKLDSQIEKIMYLIVHAKTYCQCWSMLSESDAMWRIYAYNNRAVQIKTSTDKVELLQDIDIVPVKYTNDFSTLSYDDEKKELLSAMGIKRTAFEHEKEVRLINHYRFTDDNDFETQIKAFYAVHEHKDMLKFFDSLNEGEPMEETVDRCVKLLNEGNAKKTTKSISIKDVPNFIEGVKVHPMAPKWYVDAVEEYCSRNSIVFNGKSKLYTKD